MYPGSEVNKWIDKTVETNPKTESVDNSVLFLTASSFDKGPDDRMVRVKGDNFYKLFGYNNRFTKHGQAAIQAARIIDAGGELLVKRMVANDATLPNIVFLANLTSTTTEVPKTEEDPSTDQLSDTDEVEGTTDSEIEVQTTNTLKWTAVYIENCYSFAQVKEEAKKLFDPEAKVFPLITIGDNGRGKSTKKVQISRNNEVSSSVGKQFYDVNVYEGTTRTDVATATLDSTIYNGVQYGLEEFSAVQVKFDVDQEVFEAYRAAVAEAIGIEESELYTHDMINLMTIKGVKLDGIELDPESIDMSVAYGVELNGGSNGEFGDAPINSPALEEALVEFFSGSTDIDIYDLDEYKIGAVVDACYPYNVKEAIAKLVTFREDCVFFRDFRLDADSYGTTVEVMKKFETNNKFVGNYMTWYQIYDPATKRRIPVTMMYDFAACLVKEFDTGIHYPTAGIANSFILESAIEGTVCYTPRKTPTINQKQMMEDIHVNYAIFQSGKCILQSLYTSQKEFSQLSYVNNVLGIQEVVRSVRTSCPKKRYTFVDNQDFTDYADEVNRILKNFKTNFDYLAFDYYKDSLLAHHKIFYGSITFAFKDWAQTELFDIIAINNNEIVADM